MPHCPDVDITLARGAAIKEVQNLWREYWDSFRLSPDFQNFSEELGTLPGVYAPPAGRLLLAIIDGQSAGTAALRPFGPDSCEAKRLYVRPQYRKRGVARALLDRLIEEARTAGYEYLYGDTLPAMAQALEMYKQMGFIQIEPYSTNPTPGAIFLRLSLLER